MVVEILSMSISAPAEVGRKEAKDVPAGCAREVADIRVPPASGRRDAGRSEGRFLGKWSGEEGSEPMT